MTGVPKYLKGRLDEASVRKLDEAPREEVHYYVPGAGRGFTRDKVEAERWAANRARVFGLPSAVLTRTVQFSSWSVSSTAERAELHTHEVTP